MTQSENDRLHQSCLSRGVCWPVQLWHFHNSFINLDWKWKTSMQKTDHFFPTQTTKSIFTSHQICLFQHNTANMLKCREKNSECWVVYLSCSDFIARSGLLTSTAVSSSWRKIIFPLRCRVKTSKVCPANEGKTFEFCKFEFFKNFLIRCTNFSK